MSDRVSASPVAFEALEDRILLSASAFSNDLEVTPAAGPEISVRRGDQEILDGQAALVFFPATPQNQRASTAQFVITNEGTSTLTLGAVTVPNRYIIMSLPASSVEPGESTVLRVRLNTAVPGTFNGQITIANNDSDENPFNFPVRGRVIPAAAPPDIDVFAGETKIQPSQTTPVNLGQVNQGGNKSFTFRVRNDGGTTLNITNISLPPGYSLTNNVGSTIAAGEQDTFTVAVNTATPGVKSGNIVISTNDPDADEAAFTFPITATVNSGGGTGIEPDAFEGATGDDTPAFSRFHFNNDRYRFHNIHNTTDVDWIRFYVPQTSYVAIRAVHQYDDPGANDNIRLRLYGPKPVNNPAGIELTPPGWNAAAVPQPDRPNDTILVRAGVRALTQGWYWLSADGMGGTVTQYGIRVYVRPLAASVAAEVEAHQANAAGAAALASYSQVATVQSSTPDDNSDESDDTLLEIEPVLGFLA